MADFSPALVRAHSLIKSVVASLPNLFIAVLVLLIFIGISRLVNRIIQRILENRLHSANLGYVLGRLVAWLVITAGSFVALSVVVPSLSAGDLVQLLGITSVAVGFAFRDIFQNFLAGILLLLTQPFHVGDRIQVKGYEGVVEDIQTRATRIRNDDGELVVVPNATLFTESVTVRRREHRRRLEVEFSLKGASIGDAKTRILEAIRALPSVEPDSRPEVLVSAISPDSVTFKVRWWITGKTSGTESKNQVMEAIQQVLAAKEEEEKAEQAQPSAQPA